MKSLQRHHALSAAFGPLLVALGLAACGGGGGGDNGGAADATQPLPVTPALSPVLTTKLSLLTADELGGLTPMDTNGLDQVAGSVNPVGGRSYAAVWTAGTVHRVGGTVCDGPLADRLNCLSSALRLNDQGAVLVNWSTLEDQGFHLIVNDLSRGVYASSYGLDLAADNSVLAALGPNRISTWLAPSQNQDGVWQTRAEIPVNAAGNRPLAQALNAAGAMVANQQEADASFSGFIFDGVTQNRRQLAEANGLKGSFGAALDAQGAVVGSVGPSDTARPALWAADGSLRSVLLCPGDLGVALTIQSKGVIGGACGGPNLAQQRGALWQDMTHVDVNTLLDPPSVAAGWVVQRVSRINANGWMIADAAKAGGDAVSVLLRPASP